MSDKTKIKDEKHNTPVKDQVASKKGGTIPETKEELDETELDKVSGGGRGAAGQTSTG